MGWILFFGADLRDRDRLERAAAAERMEIRGYSPGSWDPLEPPALVIVDLDRVGIPESLPEGVRVVGYYSHVNEETEKLARAAEIEAIPRGKFWPGLSGLLNDL